MANYVVKGTITCEPEDLEMFRDAVGQHEALTIAEAGCLEFSITQSSQGSCEFQVRERFVDQAAFDAHTARTRASEWWGLTKHIPRQLNHSGG